MLSDTVLSAIVTTVGAVTVAVVSGWVALREHKQPYERLASAMKQFNDLQRPEFEHAFLKHVDEVFARTVVRRSGVLWTVGFGLFAFGYLAFTVSGFVPVEQETSQIPDWAMYVGLTGLTSGAIGLTLFLVAEIRTQHHRRRVVHSLRKKRYARLPHSVADPPPEPTLGA